MPGLCHWGPLIAITIITTVTLSSAYSSLQLWSLPEPIVKYFRRTHFYLMFVWLIPILWNFVRAMRGPGYVPLGWKPNNPDDEECLQYCRVCQGFKPPRSHHCKMCKRCCMKMDHHCPWINSCVGHANHASFIRFLFFVPFGCMHGAIVNSYFIYHLLDYQFVFHQPYMGISTGWILFVVTGISLGAGTTLGVFILFATQVKIIIVNRTQIEDWILEKANHRRRMKALPPYVYPYNLGWWKNFTQVIRLSGKTVGDGTEWPVREGCSKYSFTIEQLEIKKLKRERAVTCRVKKDYSGTRYPVYSFGIMTALCLPCCAEKRIRVCKGDMMSVTRWQGRWVYGNMILSEADTVSGKEIKGWFPRGCIYPILTELTQKSDPHNTSQNSDTRASDHSDSQLSDSDTDIEQKSSRKPPSSSKKPPPPASRKSHRSPSPASRKSLLKKDQKREIGRGSLPKKVTLATKVKKSNVATVKEDMGVKDEATLTEGVVEDKTGELRKRTKKTSEST